MARYTYSGGLTSLSIPGKKPGDDPAFEEIMHEGKAYDLPDHDLVKAWVARGWLKPVPAEPEPARDEPAPQATRRLAAPAATSTTEG